MSNAIEFIKSITKNTILGQIIIGVILLLISSAGNVSIGEFHYTLSSTFWTWSLFLVGVILVVVALIVQVIPLFSKEEIYKERASVAQKYVVLSDQARNSISEALGTERIISLLRQRINDEEKARTQFALADLSERIHVQRIALSNLEQVIKGVMVISSLEEDITKEDIPDLLSNAFGALLEATISIPLPDPSPSQDDIQDALLSGILEGELPSNSQVHPFYFIGKQYRVTQEMSLEWYFVSRAIPTLIDEFPKIASRDLETIVREIIQRIDVKDIINMYEYASHNPQLEVVSS